jgi:hypothetical protein
MAWVGSSCKRRQVCVLKISPVQRYNRKRQLLNHHVVAVTQLINDTFAPLKANKSNETKTFE